MIIIPIWILLIVPVFIGISIADRARGAEEVFGKILAAFFWPVMLAGLILLCFNEYLYTLEHKYPK